MKKVLIFASMLGVSLGCTNHHIDACSADRPIDQIPWLKTMKESIDCSHCAHAIVKATYKGQTVFYYQAGGALCDVVFRIDLRNCNGDTIRTYFPRNQEELQRETKSFQDEVTNRQTLYECGF